ncbi:CheY-like chemotaxis protein [Desulfobaculum xiamenense]|uniref:CheY-like chemotaxis protein n=1 Tax=Desulfobaculum xiamenense TaxID=995050 RepID=A0A846QR08_9BACT|nr:response regulator [Desulfobaculum xiamenense]NJB67825.1 CheY-like chemotaxis protein [Desulfobaculum xiamenense]
MSFESPVILIVDDEALIRATLADFFEDCGFDVHTAGSGEEGLEKLAALAPDFVTVDMRLPGMDGNDFILAALAIRPGLRFLIFTGSADYVLPMPLRNAGLTPEHVFMKPVQSLEALLGALEKLYGFKAEL